MRRRLNYANVTATLALFFALSGGALAAKHYVISSTNQISPKVLSALKGKTGPTGEPATKLWAVVSAAGRLEKGSGAVSVKTEPGAVYQVKFNRNITKCAHLGTVGAPDFERTEHGDIDVQGLVGTKDSLVIETFNNAGSAAERGFNVAVFC